MRTARDDITQWSLAWLMHIMHPDPQPALSSTKLAFRSNNMVTRNGYAKRLFSGNGHKYEIVVYRRMDDRSLLSVLAHEVRHITQYDSGRLMHVPGGWMWENEFFHKDTPYMERPWEIEARQSEYLGFEALDAYNLMQNSVYSADFIWYKDA